MHVALIDPSRVVLKIVTEMLTAGGHTVVAFTDSGKALAHVEEQLPREYNYLGGGITVHGAKHLTLPDVLVARGGRTRAAAVDRHHASTQGVPYVIQRWRGAAALGLVATHTHPQAQGNPREPLDSDSSLEGAAGCGGPSRLPSALSLGTVVETYSNKLRFDAA